MKAGGPGAGGHPRWEPFKPSGAAPSPMRVWSKIEAISGSGTRMTSAPYAGANARPALSGDHHHAPGKRVVQVACY